MATKFELYKDKAGEFRWRLRHQNGEIIASGEGYTTKANALNGIESVKKNAPDAPTKDMITKAEKPAESKYAPGMDVSKPGKSPADWLAIGVIALFVAWVIYVVVTQFII